MRTMYRVPIEGGKAEKIEVDGGFIYGKDMAGHTCRVSTCPSAIGDIEGRQVLRTCNYRWSASPLDDMVVLWWIAENLEEVETWRKEIEESGGKVLSVDPDEAGDVRKYHVTFSIPESKARSMGETEDSFLELDDKKETRIKIGTVWFDIPDGYVHVKWDDVHQGDQVWLIGTMAGRPYAYGPHQVVDPSRHQLCNYAGHSFTEMTESLLKEGRG